jgi:hypothetical protein
MDKYNLKNKMMHVRRSKEPLHSQLEAITNNLRVVSKNTVCVSIRMWGHQYRDGSNSLRFSVSIWIEKEAKHYYADSWDQVFDIYYDLMEKYRKG